MALERGVDPRYILRPNTAQLLLEKTGPVCVIDRIVALRFRSNGGSELEVTSWDDILMLDRKRLSDEGTFQRFINSDPGEGNILGSMAFHLSNDPDKVGVYVGKYHIGLLAETRQRMGIVIASPDEMDIKTYSRLLEPKVILKNLRRDNPFFHR